MKKKLGEVLSSKNVGAAFAILTSAVFGYSIWSIGHGEGYCEGSKKTGEAFNKELSKWLDEVESMCSEEE